MPFPDLLPIEPLSTPPSLTMHVPGSKSITNRALVLAALACRDSDSLLSGVLQCDDTEVMVASLRKLGFEVHADWKSATPTIRVLKLASNVGNPVPATQADLFVADSGTCMRFLTALTALGCGHFRLDGSPRMRERPIEDLLFGLRSLGARAECERHNGCPPVAIESRGLKGGDVEVKGDLSSQFLSALLMAVPLADGDVTISVVGPLVSQPYVDMTIQMVRDFGGVIDKRGPSAWRIPGGQRFRATPFIVEPDASAASYFWAAAAITGGTIGVAGLGRDSLQGDVGFVRILEQMGCQTIADGMSLKVQGGPLRGIDVDMSAMSDCVMTLAAVACFAEGPTTIRNVSHIRHKESDRLRALATELRKVGAEVEERADGLTIRPGTLRGSILDTHDDHRMAMSLALLGLKVPGIVVRSPGCVAKTYPRYFEDLQQLYGAGNV